MEAVDFIVANWEWFLLGFMFCEKLVKLSPTQADDIIIVRKWAVQSDKKSDLVYRYTKTQVEHLRRKGLIPEVIDIQ